MKTITMVLEAGKDLFSAYSENVEGIYGAGGTIEECMQSVLDCIDFIMEDPDDRIPEALRGEYDIVYRYDTESFLAHYKGILTHSALERLAGINRKQMQHYASGLKRPRHATARKIEAALHRLGRELQAVRLT